LNHLGIKPWTDRIKQYRGRQLVQAFPQYDAELLMAYSESTALYKTAQEKRNEKRGSSEFKSIE
jgi:hypothetical protein